MSNGVTVGTNVPTPSQLSLQRQLGLGLIQSGQQASPRTGLQAISPIAQSLVGALLMRQANQGQQQRQQAANQALLRLLGGTSGGGGGPAGGAMAGTPATGGLAALPGLGGPPGTGSTAPLGATPGAPMVSTPGAGQTASAGSPLGQIAARQQSGPQLAALLQASQQFPELASVIGPLVASRLQPQRPVALGVGQRLVNPATGQTVVAAQPQPRTELAKLQADQALAVQTYGRNSPQARAFNEAIAAERRGEPVDLTDEAGQRKEFTKLSGDFIALRDAFGKIRNARDTAAGDLSLIFNYMKMLDPGSVVREGEFATAQNTAGVPERVRNTYNRLMTGERLSPNQRTNFKQQAGDVFASQREQQNLLEGQFRGLAGRSGLRPENVVVDFQGDLREFDSGTLTPDANGNGGTEPPAEFTPDELQAMSDEEIRALLAQ